MSTSLTNKCLGFIGVGVMGSSIIKSLLMKSITSDQICIADKSPEKLEQIKSQYQVKVKEISTIAESCNVIFLAVKPQDLADVLDELKQTIQPETLVISIAAGKTIKFIEDQLQTNNPVIRAMPNTPAQIGKGISAIAASAKVSSDELKIATELFLTTGEVVVVTEDKIDAVTALSGSGPAYFFYFIEAMVKAGVELGLTDEIATKLAIETISGSAAMLKESNLDAATLRKNVTSPKGTTAAALEVFSNSDLENIILKAMSAAKNRAQELA
jgi:pyrroline-5-carboxylate reductase